MLRIKKLQYLYEFLQNIMHGFGNMMKFKSIMLFTLFSEKELLSSMDRSILVDMSN